MSAMYACNCDNTEVVGDTMGLASHTDIERSVVLTHKSVWVSWGGD